MSTLKLDRIQKTFIVTMLEDKFANTFTDDVLNEHISVLEEIEKADGNGAVILTSNDPKFFCNGINLDWLLAQGSDYIPTFKKTIDKMLLKWATLMRPTIAVLNGHTYGGGAILSCGFDFRLMRADRGYFCFPEVDINIPFTEIMHHIIQLLPDRQSLKDLAFTGRRIGGEEALKLKVVDAIYSQDELLNKALELAHNLSEKNRATYAEIKRGFREKLLGYVS